MGEQKSEMGTLRVPAFACLVLVIFLGCTEKRGEGSKTSKFSVLRIGYVGPIFHNQVFSQSDVNFWKIQSQWLFRSLLNRDPVTGKLVLDLAESYKWGPDKASLSIQLKAGQKWSDGRPITAEDVKFTVESHSDPRFESIYLGVYDKRVKEVEVKSEHELIVHFRFPSPSHLKAVALNMPIYPRHGFTEEAKQVSLLPTSGPFVVKAFVPGKSMILDQNPSWKGAGWQGFDRLSLRWFESFRGVVAAANENELDFFEVKSPFEFKKASVSLGPQHWDGVKALGYKLLGRHTLVLNHKNQVLQDVTLRRCLKGLVNLEKLNQKLYSGLLEVAKGPWSSSHPAGMELKPSTSECADPKAELKAVGWNLNGDTGVLEKNFNGEPLPLRLRLISFSKEFEPFLTIYAEKAKGFGVKVEIIKQSFWEAMKSFESGSADGVYIYSPWIPFELNLKSWYQSEDDGNPWTNPGQFKDKELDGLIKASEKEYNESKRLKLLRRAFERLVQLSPDLYLYNDKYRLYYVRSDIKRPQDTLPYSLGLSTWSKR